MKTLIKNGKCAGFSIIELSIVLSIIALIAVSALAIGAAKLDETRTRITKERMEYIMDTLDLFVDEFNYIPCPSDISLAPDDNNFGDGRTSPPTGTGYCIAENGNDGAVTNVIYGGLPVKQLAISYDMSRDGWGRRFTYVVDEDVTWQGGTSPGDTGFQDPTVDGNITITNGAGGITQASDAVVVLISHGADGHGAWPGKGGTIINKGCTTDADEDDNTSLAGCTAFDSNFVQKFRTGTFDDFVEYRVKWHF